MKLIARKNLLVRPLGHVGFMATKSVAEGQTFEVDDDQAQKLIKNGDAIQKPKATRRAAGTEGASA